MSEPIIKVENLSKKYKIGKRESYYSLRDKIGSIFDFKRGEKKDSEFWALKDINFEVKAGESVGIIGRNGAGKSTLLKILSQITPPTTGKITLRGRVASLLEVGTGFNPELTGRENIFLNGAILGMTRAEIKRKFDEIVAFAEIEQFLDTPVKRYSSGMYMRLAFAVAAHLESEILIVDEVLAVGDAQFQKKCLGKMDDVAKKEGRTVLFVSHNLQAVSQLCQNSILLSNGKVNKYGLTEKIISSYMKDNITVRDMNSIGLIIKNLPKDDCFEFCSIEMKQEKTPIDNLLIQNGKDLEIIIRYRAKQNILGLRVYFDLCDEDNNILFRSFHDEMGTGIVTTEAGNYISFATVPANLLAPREYYIKVYSTIYNVRTFVPEGISFPIVVQRNGLANKAYPEEPIRGKLAPVISWNTLKYV